MKKIIPTIICAVAGLAFLAGCQSTDKNASPATSANTNMPAAGVTDPTHVAILYSNPTRAYTEVGSVASPKPGNAGGTLPPGQTWQYELQKQAGARGADAVVVDTSTLNNINTPMVTGTAIRYR
jgi:hypothetical protein